MTLPNDTSDPYALTFDTTGLWGGDLIVGTDTGNIWTISSTGVANLIATIPNAGYVGLSTIEGMITIPNDPAYGPLAGTILVSSETNQQLYSIPHNGSPVAVSLMSNGQSQSLGVSEDLSIIPADENFYGADGGSSRLLAAPAADFAGMAGQILVSQERPSSGSGLWRIYWDGSNLQTAPIALTGTSSVPGGWEGTTFAPAGVTSIAPTPGAPGLPDWTVNLLNSSSQVVATTTTDPYGDYVFANVANGTYTVQEVPQTGWTQVLPASPGTYTVTLTGGQTSFGDNFDNVPTQSSNQAPAFTTTWTASAQIGVKYVYNAWAADPDFDRLSFDLPVHPAGMVIDPVHGILVWTPTPDEVRPPERHRPCLRRPRRGGAGAVHHRCRAGQRPSPLHVPGRDHRHHRFDLRLQPQRGRSRWRHPHLPPEHPLFGSVPDQR